MAALFHHQMPLSVLLVSPALLGSREEPLTDPACVFGGRHCVAHSSGVCEDLMVIATRHSLVSKEINGLIASMFQVSQAIPLIPSFRKDVNADLATYGEREAFPCKLLPQVCYELLSYMFFFIEFVEFNSFFLAAASSNWGHIQHAISEFNESSPGEENGTRGAPKYKTPYLFGQQHILDSMSK